MIRAAVLMSNTDPHYFQPNRGHQTVAYNSTGHDTHSVRNLLHQAQNLWGKRYAEIIAAVPPELLAQWDVQLSQGEGRV
jgi:hypothetical protein